MNNIKQRLKYKGKIYYHLSVLFILIIALNSCSTQKKIPKHNNSQVIEKVIYDYYFEFPSNAEHSIEELQDTFIANFQNKYGIILKDEILDKVRFVDTLRNTPRMEIHVEFSGDSIWRYKTIDKITRFEVSRLDLLNGIYYLQNNKEQSTNKKIDLFEGDSIYIVQEFPENKAIINGYNCHKILLSGCTMSIEKFPFSIGNFNYEMYVTDEIDIPLHAIIPINKRFDNYFPMKARIWGECDGFVKVYELKEIKFKR